MFLPRRRFRFRVTMRRLSWVEYRNTIRDLIGTEFDPTEDPLRFFECALKRGRLDGSPTEK